MKLEIKNINLLLLFVIVYFMAMRRYTNADEILIILLGIGVFYERIRTKEYFKIDRKIVFIGILSLILMLLNYYKLSQILDLSIDNIETRQNKELFNVALFKYFLFGIILSQMKVEEKYRKILIYFIALCSLYVISKGIDFGLTYSFSKRCDLIWRHFNYLSMMLGVFSLISFVGALEVKKRYLKFIFSLIFMAHIFLLVTIGQSRNIFLSLLISFGVMIFLTQIKEFKFYSYLKMICFSIFGIIIIYLIMKYFFPDLRIIKSLNIDVIKNDGRVFILKKAREILSTDKEIGFFTGKGFAYYIIAKLKTGREVLGSFHNDILELIITQGYLSGISYFLFLIFSLFRFIKEYFKKKDNGVLLVILLLVYVFFSGMLDNIIYADRVLQFLVLFLFLNIPKKVVKI